MAADSDMKTISELETFFDSMDENSLFPIVVNVDSHNTTDNIRFPALKAQIVGTEYTGTLSAGSTSITFNSATNVPDYSDQTSYSVGQKCKHSGKYYMCVIATSGANWDTNKVKFVEYPQITTTSTVDVYTDTFGVNPTNVVVADGSVTLTFSSQSSDIGVKVRVS